jgi:hypothetical protein
MQRAEARTSLRGDAVHVVLLAECGTGFPWEVAVPFGTAHGRAHDLAERWVKDTPIEIRAAGARPKLDHGVASLVPLGVTTIHVAGVPYAGGGW